jgi:membrane protein required for colicin V production
MNLLDYLLVAILGYCLVRGIFRGLVKELSSIIGVLGGFYAAYTYYPQMAKPLGHWIENTGYLNILSFLILFVGIYLVVSITGVMIKHLMNIVFLGWVDRIGGALFGAVKGFLITTVVILILTTFLPKNAAILRQSLVSQYMIHFSATLVKVAPKEMKHRFGEKMYELRQSWQSKKR